MTQPDAAALPHAAMPRPTTWRLTLYGAGEAATSLVLNGLNGFALLFYTEALGLRPELAGLALSVSIFWEAITEPVMGHVSDRTRSRWGMRYPWIVAGGTAMALIFYMLWHVPGAFLGGGAATFGYLLVLNLLLRTALTMFIVPYLALGFELAPGYEDRPRLQSVRWVCNMAANAAGPALAWTIFFVDRREGGRTIAGTADAANFAAMGGSFSVAMLALTAILVWGCRHTVRDTRRGATGEGIGDHPVGFWRAYRPIVANRDVQRVLVLIFLLVVGMVVASSIQGYLYVHFLSITGPQKTLVHGSTMLASGLGAAISPWAVRRFDKRGASIFGCWIGIAGAAGLGLCFLVLGMPRTGAIGIGTFVLFQGLYWMASGVVLPVATAMIADLAEIAGRREGRTLDGSYSAIFSLAWRIGVSISLLLSGVLIGVAGYDAAGHAAPAPAVLDRMAAMSFAAGAIFYAAALLWVRGYRLDRARYADEAATV